nr:hypothetical protein CFP56_62884 [Quercus suber]
MLSKEPHAEWTGKKQVDVGNLDEEMEALRLPSALREFIQSLLITEWESRPTASGALASRQYSDLQEAALTHLERLSTSSDILHFIAKNQLWKDSRKLKKRPTEQASHLHARQKRKSNMINQEVEVTLWDGLQPRSSHVDHVQRRYDATLDGPPILGGKDEHLEAALPVRIRWLSVPFCS